MINGYENPQFQNLLALVESEHFDEAKFFNRVMGELHHTFTENGVMGIRLRFLKVKVREDLEHNYQQLIEQQGEASVKGRKPRELFSVIQPPYMHQLADEEIINDLVDVFIDRMLEGSMKIPDKLPGMLGQLITKEDPVWSDAYLDQNVPEKNMLQNQQLCVAVFEKAGLA